MPRNKKGKSYKKFDSSHTGSDVVQSPCTTSASSKLQSIAKYFKSPRQGLTSSVEDQEAKCQFAKTSDRSPIKDIVVNENPGEEKLCSNTSPETKLTKAKKKEKITRKPEAKKDDKMKQKKITNIFPTRKSSRKTKSQQDEERQAEITKAILSKTVDGLEVQKIDDKGRGVFASRVFSHNQFVCEYSGELITYEEAKQRELKYSENKNIGCYMYYLQSGNKKYCIDATAEDGTLGRLLNHSRSGNCKTKVHVINDIPHLIFLTTRRVNKGEELTYDYGDRSKSSIESHPWLKY